MRYARTTRTRSVSLRPWERGHPTSMRRRRGGRCSSRPRSFGISSRSRLGLPLSRTAKTTVGDNHRSVVAELILWFESDGTGRMASARESPLGTVLARHAPVAGPRRWRGRGVCGLSMLQTPLPPAAPFDRWSCAPCGVTVDARSSMHPRQRSRPHPPTSQCQPRARPCHASRGPRLARTPPGPP